MRMSFFAGLAVCSLAVVSTPALATEAETLAEAITDGKVELNFRYRAESVEQTGFALDAFSSTLRTKLKYTSGVFKGFSGVLEFDNVTNIGANAFNSTVNGRTRFPVIADPQITEVNQAYLAYTGIDDTKLMAGRVALNMNNQRFFGTVGWRQNDQTWDMLGFINSSIPDLTLTGAYVWNVNRIFGNDHPLGDLDTNTVLIDAKYSGLGFGNLTSYALLIDLNDAPVLGRSSQTYGIRFDGKHKMADGGFTVLYEAEYATQSDYSSNPTNFNVDYFHIAGGLSAAGFTAKLGFETLGTDNGNFAFQTPFATLHKFNGWADIF
ncbi:MAG: hypothetical protein JKX99_09330, partial [Robiginitomaculum sp.]|nr:hypothetical protein [Robiginitomaculum sp.]